MRVTGRVQGLAALGSGLVCCGAQKEVSSHKLTWTPPFGTTIVFIGSRLIGFRVGCLSRFHGSVGQSTLFRKDVGIAASRVLRREDLAAQRAALNFPVFRSKCVYIYISISVCTYICYHPTPLKQNKTYVLIRICSLGPSLGSWPLGFCIGITFLDLSYTYLGNTILLEVWK